MNDANVSNVPRDKIDVSRPELFGDDTWRPWFERLRREDPVHYHAESANGPYWSVTAHGLIKQVDTSHRIFSSETGGITIVDGPQDEGQSEGYGTPIENFIAMDPPRHDEQRATVSPAVAPTNLVNLEPVIRERVIDILENLTIGKTFNWVDKVSIELTPRMLATLFGFPYEDRRKLVHWSDITTDIPQVTGNEDTDLKERHEELMRCAEVPVRVNPL